MSEIEKVDVNFLSQYVVDDKSLVGMDEYRILPSLKIIQAMSDKELKKQYGEGSVLIMPGGAPVWREGEDPFLFVAHFFYAEFAKWSDINDQESPMILQRSYDNAGDFAKRARNKELRFESYGDNNQYQYRYVEHLRFPGVIYGDHPLAGTLATLSFQRGEFGQGKNFISAVKMRKHKINGGSAVLPLWSQVWGFAVGERTWGGKNWLGFDFVPRGVIKEEDAEEMRNAFLEMKELHEKDRLIVEETLTGEEEEKSENSGPFQETTMRYLILVLFIGIACTQDTDKNGITKKGWDEPIAVLDCFSPPEGPWDTDWECYLDFRNAERECQECCQDLDPDGYWWCVIHHCDQGMNDGVSICFPDASGIP